MDQKVLTNKSIEGKQFGYRVAQLVQLVFATLFTVAMLACTNPLLAKAKDVQTKAASPVITINKGDGTALASSAEIDFGAVGIGNSRNVILTVSNTGSTVLQLNNESFKFTLDDGTSDETFSLPSIPADVAPAGSTTFTIRFSDDMIGSYGATLTIKSNDVAMPEFSIRLKGIVLSSDKEFANFSIDSPVSAVGTISGTTISIMVPNQTNRTNMQAVFVFSGTSVKVGTVPQTSGSTINDFTNPVVYTVVADDGSERDFTVTVTLDPTSKELTSFGIKSPSCNGIFEGNNITVFIPYSTSKVLLTSVFTTTGKSVKVDGTDQTSGSGSRNFSSPVIYRVTAIDDSYKDYSVRVLNNPGAPVVTPHNNAIDVSWTADSLASGYEVWYNTQNIPENAVQSGGTVAAGTTSATISGLVNETSYYVWTKNRYTAGTNGITQTVTSGFSNASDAAMVNPVYYGWLYTGDSGGISRYPLNASDGTVGSGINVLYPSSLANPNSVSAMALDPTGQFLFYAYKRSINYYNFGSAKIDAKTGDLTANTLIDSLSDVYNIYDLILSPDRRHLYAISSYSISGGMIRYFDIDQSTGQLTDKGWFSTPGCFQRGGVNAEKGLLYFTGYGSGIGNIYTYEINADTGALTLKSTVSTGLPYALAATYEAASDRVAVAFQITTSPAQNIGLRTFALDSNGYPISDQYYSVNLNSYGWNWQRILSSPVPGMSGMNMLYVLNTDSPGIIGLYDNSDMFTPLPYYTEGVRDGLLLTSPTNVIHLYAAGGSTVIHGVVPNPSTTDNNLGSIAGTDSYTYSTMVVQGAFFPW